VASGSSGISRTSSWHNHSAPSTSSCRATELGPTGDIALIQHQVDHGQNLSQPLAQQLIGRNPQGDTSSNDLAFRADDALCNCCLAGEEGMCDLGGRQANNRPQRQRDLRRTVQRRVTAGEQQCELIVHGRLRANSGGLLKQRQLLAVARVPPPAIDRFATSGGQ
jgi:hypothetical protein